MCWSSRADSLPSKVERLSWSGTVGPLIAYIQASNTRPLHSRLSPKAGELDLSGKS